ncbi:hypothetical protein SH661x_003423 [Planctomicrobium sp. SH661]|uniref:prenyltransferase/squalene oxidase repeat-containing protein n=1 Tax=Planctomicrobium sp. SH661 TaxID=3448124 RepID=UPI003F5CB638
MSWIRSGVLNLIAFCSLLPQLCGAAAPTAEEIDAAIGRGVDFLKTTQGDDGTWTSPTSLGVTGLVTYSLLISGVPVDDPAVQAALKNIEANIQPDGGIYHKDSTHKNYETAIMLQAMVAANADGRYQSQIDRAVKFVKELQWDDAESAPRENPNFGGAGYGKSARPDLSNTAFFLDALKAAGVSSHDPAMQNALVFVSRCQNLTGPHNDTTFPEKVNDGGFYYTPSAGGSSQAGETPNGGLRSYGSMTYAGLKSMIYAGLTEDDPRVKAAEEWLRKFYSLEENPGMGQQGLFYYYQTVAKTMEALGREDFSDANGTRHLWRVELADQILSRQKPNGSWLNETPRWMEGDPNLVTAYSLITLKYCKPGSGK